MNQPRIRHDARNGLFEIEVDGHSAHVEYRREGGTMTILHTIVPEPIGGRGIARTLTEAAVDYARREGLRVEPRCPYAAAYFQRHPELADLLLA